MYTSLWVNRKTKRVVLDFAPAINFKKLRKLGDAKDNLCMYAGADREHAKFLLKGYMDMGYESIT